MAFTTEQSRISFTDVGYSETHNREGTVAERTIQVSWSNYGKVPGDFLGTHYIGAGPAGGAGNAGATIVRSLPERHPEKAWLWATDCRLIRTIGAPIENANAIPSTDWREMPANVNGRVEYLVTYTKPPYDVLNDADTGGNELKRYVERKTTYTVEAVQTVGKMWEWASDSEPIQEPGSLLLGSTQLEYKWWCVPTGNTIDTPAALRENKWATTYQGFVNSAIFDTVKLNAAVETVLLMGWNKEGPFSDGDGHELYNVTFNLVYRPNTWNFFLRRRLGAAPTYQAVRSREDHVTKPYVPSDIGKVFDVSS